MKQILVLALASLGLGCATPSQIDPASFIKLEKGGCGYVAACPAYAITLKPDGSYHYEGFRNVATIGTREGALPPDTWTKAEKAFQAAGWSTLEDPTSRKGGFPCMPDSPFAKITRQVKDGDARVFSFNLGCDSELGGALLTTLDSLMPPPAAP